MFSCEFCKISKNNVFTEHLWATASKCYNRCTFSQSAHLFKSRDHYDLLELMQMLAYMQKLLQLNALKSKVSNSLPFIIILMNEIKMVDQIRIVR